MSRYLNYAAEATRILASSSSGGNSTGGGRGEGAHHEGSVHFKTIELLCHTGMFLEAIAFMQSDIFYLRVSFMLRTIND